MFALCLLVFNFDLERLDALSELFVAVVKLELVQFSRTNLTFEEVVLHLQLLHLLLKANMLLLLDSDSSVDLGALRV